MSGETEQNISGWTVDTLKEYVGQRFADQDKAVQAALLAAKEAVLKAEAASEKRFECVAAETPVLCADLIWRPAGELKVGDELIALDEDSPSRSGRRFRRAIVTANSLESDKLFSVNTPVGIVKCNANHPWLVRNHAWEWVKTSDIKVGDEVAHPVDVWEIDSTWESGWLAGMFDGEGCLSIGTSVGKPRVQLSLSQRESKTSDKIAKALLDRLGREALSYRYEPGTSSTPNNTVPFFHFLIVRKPDIMKILGSTRPPRLLIKSDGVWEDKVIAGNDRWAVVTSIEDAGVGNIAQLSTSTKTYIAGGFAMHNSVNEFRQQLSDQTNTFLPRPEYNAQHKALEEKVALLTDIMNQDKGGDLSMAKIYAAIGAVGVFLGIIVLLANNVFK